MSLRLKDVLRYIMAAGMVFTGVEHFLHASGFAAIIPDFLPAHLLLVEISGIFEIAFGLGLLFPSTQKAAAWGLILLYIAVFPANINMAVQNMPINGVHHPLLLWLRLPLQFVLIAWAWWYTIVDKKKVVK